MPIILYTKTDCPWSAEVRELFHEKKVQFEERNVTDSQEFRDELFIKSGQTKTPTLDVDGRIIANTDRDEVWRELKL